MGVEILLEGPIKILQLKYVLDEKTIDSDINWQKRFEQSQSCNPGLFLHLCYFPIKGICLFNYTLKISHFFHQCKFENFPGKNFK